MRQGRLQNLKLKALPHPASGPFFHSARPLQLHTAVRRLQAVGGFDRRFDAKAARRWQQGAVILDHAHQGADFIGVLFSSSCERFRLAVSFSI